MTRRLVVEADGGSRGNPGPAGWGALVRDAASGEVISRCAAAIGRETNNVAEYHGLLSGLEQAAGLDPDPGFPVEVRMDSKLVVEQMSGRWQVKHPAMRTLAARARDLARALPGGVTYSWVPRARNGDADALANQAMDAAAAGRSWQPGASARHPPAALADRPGRSADPPRSGWRDPAAVATTTLLLRHGQTPMSVDRRFSGSSDPDLTDLGRAQAHAAAARLVAFPAARRPVALVTSPRRRAAQTAAAAAAALGLDVVVDDGLVETSFGDWEGYTFAEVRQRWPGELAAWLDDPEVAPPYGESFAATHRRVRRARDRIVAAHPAAVVLVVSHVTPVKSLLRMALDAPAGVLHRIHLDLASLCEVGWYGDGPALVRSVNDTAHLGGLPPA